MYILVRVVRIGLASIFLFPTVTMKANNVIPIIIHIDNITVLAFFFIDNHFTIKYLNNQHYLLRINTAPLGSSVPSSRIHFAEPSEAKTRFSPDLWNLKV